MSNSMASYLSVVTPNVADNLDIDYKCDFIEIGDKNHEIVDFNIFEHESISFTNEFFFNVNIAYMMIPHSVITIITDFYLNSSKGNGMANTFKWTHPIERVIYIARFSSINFERSFKTNFGSISFQLKILGRAALIAEYLLIGGGGGDKLLIGGSGGDALIIGGTT